MDKREKSKYDVAKWLRCGFWTMIALFVVILIFSYLTTKASVFAYFTLITQVLFYIDVIFVFVNAVLYLSPERGFAILALIVSGVFFLFLVLAFLALSYGSTALAGANALG